MEDRPAPWLPRKREPDVGAPAQRYDITVLLVDDQPLVGEAVRRALADQPDISFHFCSSGADAMQVAERIRPAIILQDLIMPGTDGLTLLRAYRANPVTRDIPVIVLSSKDEPTLKSESFVVGANDYLVKLPNSIELIARIRHHVKAYLNQKQRDDAYQAMRESRLLLVEKNIELETLTNVDALTGLGNRRYFDDLVNVHWKQAARNQISIAILMIDVDDFKGYNDTYGHLAGDQILKRVAAAIRSCCERPTDLVARFGGEEFIVSLHAPLAGARVVANDIRRAVEAMAIHHPASTTGAVVTVCVGGASVVPRHREPPTTLIEAADAALYEAKRAGRNQVAFSA